MPVWSRGLLSVQARVNGLLWMKVWRERTTELLVGWLGGQEPERRTTWSRLARLAMDPS
jgi:hypothetical protein